MATLSARTIYDYSEQMVNKRAIAQRQWIGTSNGHQACITIVHDKTGNANYEAIVVMSTGNSRITWGRNSRNLLASVKRDALATMGKG